MQLAPLTFRLAAEADSGLLLAWRNDAATRAASINPDEVEPENHDRWLRAVLANPKRRLLMCEDSGLPVGTVRADLDGDATLLSWTVAPSARGRGIGRRMLREFLAGESPGQNFRAVIKAGNLASARMAESAGMQLESESEGVLTYRLTTR